MKRLGFKMKLNKGQEEEYRKRHAEIWPELSELLKETRISNYSIFFDEETHILFGVLDCHDEVKYAELPNHPIMKKWWFYMKDLMQTNEDFSPVSIPLEEIFFLE
ncbi:L-rhamnose mutarotase [Chryseobacterium sp.]|uniref:L-rhamnose mutarotase n=1 Tax=Chryseobacterium sp. TaxID=1871047 RepID=UPI00289DAA83|nr:L-rhamnose mutarotase [Chryseobacterium sp.]